MYYSIERIYINRTSRDNNREGKGWSPQIIDTSEKLEICTNLAWFQGFIKIYKQFFPQGDPSKFASLVFRVFDENAVSFLSRMHTSWLSTNPLASKICVRHVGPCVQRAITRCAFDNILLKLFSSPIAVVALATSLLPRLTAGSAFI